MTTFVVNRIRGWMGSIVLKAEAQGTRLGFNSPQLHFKKERCFMDMFLDCDITEYELTIVEKVMDLIKKQGNAEPNIDDLMHELIRLSDISIRHFPKEAKGTGE